MTKQKTWKSELFNIAVSFSVAVIAYFCSSYFKPGIEEMFSVVIFILVLILLKQDNKE